MKNYLIRAFAISLALGLAAAYAVAQNDTISAAAGDRYIISAKAGGVNFVEGTVAVVRKSGRSGLLLRGDNLEVGDRVSTGANGKVEILLNPGSFLRLGGTSAFEFNTTSLDDLQLRLDSGSAILEVFAADEFKVNVKTPSATYSLIKSGIFRVDVPENGNSTLRIWKGMASVGDENPVKAGRTVTASGDDAVAIAKFDKDEKDSLDQWSKQRSKLLAQQTASLRRQDIRIPLMRGFLGRQWNFFNSFGLWIYNPFISSYSFLPFGYGWYSPYGYGYGNGMSWWWQNNYPTYLPPVTGSGTGTSTGSSGGTRTLAGVRGQRVQEPNSSAAPSEIGRTRMPPFLMIERTNGAGIRGGIGRDDMSSSSGGSYSPSYSGSSSTSAAPTSSGPPAASSVPGKSAPSLRP